MGRLYGRIVKEKLQICIENKIGAHQAGLTAWKSCIYRKIYALQKLIAKNK